MQTPESFIDHYRTVFESYSAPDIAACFAFPAHVTRDAGNGAVVLAVATAHDQWVGQLGELLAAYRKIGVAKSQARSLDVVTLSPDLAQARVHWALLTDGGEPIYDFHAVYTLARFDGQLRIVAIAHDELPALRAALAKVA